MKLNSNYMNMLIPKIPQKFITITFTWFKKFKNYNLIIVLGNGIAVKFVQSALRWLIECLNLLNFQIIEKKSRQSRKNLIILRLKSFVRLCLTEIINNGYKYFNLSLCFIEIFLSKNKNSNGMHTLNVIKQNSIKIDRKSCRN
ncbi:hypothetical protein BpHYR1_044496 [Brachionus plicatilis]|uniref:Uncharacterized protein n=1 Tax=Brachionus plicatilis TaxID=10195 RepID=A0A3M7SYR2_BRAPC|nr:hypothetical protein BpHYR1_044496 [Brachionus plicatilis]